MDNPHLALNTTPKTRLHGLDYLRGLAAFGIMVYHFSTWTWGKWAPDSFLGRVGIYGVAIFYVLSGMSLSYVYSQQLVLNRGSIKRFYRKRFFRIFPLLWLATIVSIFLSKRLPNGWDVFLNLTGLFGIMKWDTYFATGSWSIGNELCFYLSFPLLLALLRKSRIGHIAAIGLPIGLFCYFAYFEVAASRPMMAQWHIYTNPLNQLALFACGVGLGFHLSRLSPNVVFRSVLGLAGIGMFWLIPVGNGPSSLIAGGTRLAFFICCLCICYGFAGIHRASVFLDKPLALLGHCSYSLYLLHPIVFTVTKAISSIASSIFPFAISSTYYGAFFCLQVITSLITSYLSYTYFELYFLRKA